MARVKTEKPAATDEAIMPQDNTAEATTETTGASVEQDEASKNVSDIEKATTAKMTNNETEKNAEIDKVLRTFSNLDELYISAKGGIFTKDTPKEMTEGANLYKNPYFKN